MMLSTSGPPTRCSSPRRKGLWYGKILTPCLSPVTTATGTCVVSYVGKANFGAAERYFCDLCTEVWTPYAITIELSAAGGQFCISWMQRFSDDAYLDSFIEELRRQGLDATITWRRPLVLATIADYYR